MKSKRIILILIVILLIVGLIFAIEIFKPKPLILPDSDYNPIFPRSHNDKLNVQSIVQLNQGDQTLISVYVVNFEIATKTFKVELTPLEDLEFQNDGIFVKSTNSSLIIPKEQEGRFYIYINASKNAKLTQAVYNIDVTADDKPYAKDAILIEVKK